MDSAEAGHDELERYSYNYCFIKGLLLTMWLYISVE